MTATTLAAELGDLLPEYGGEIAAALLALPPDRRAALAAELDPEREARLRSLDERHIVTFSETGYGLQHPVACRPDLLGCEFNIWLANAEIFDGPPGKYVMTWPMPGYPQYEPLAALRSPT